MGSFAARDFLYLAPEILLTVLGLVLLLVDLAALRGHSDRVRRLVLGGIGLAGVVLALAVIVLDLPTLTGMAYSDLDPTLFFGTIAGDLATVEFNALIVALLGMVIAISMAWSFTRAWGEYFALIVWSAVGMMLLIAAEELLTLFLTLETMTLCLYLASAFEKEHRRSPEAGLKYFVYGSVSSALFLFGLSLVYGLTGTTRLDGIRLVLTQSRQYGWLSAAAMVEATALLLILVGFGFKIAAVPFHQWAPDAYEGAPAPVSAWIGSGSKVASIVAMMKVLNHALAPWASRQGDPSSPGWLGLLALVAALSMTYGNLAALAQTNLKRLLAYSSIAHAGYLLVGVLAVSVRPVNQIAGGAVLFYLVVYAITNVGTFALAAWLARDLASDEVEDLRGMGATAPGLAVCLVLLMLSLIGMPPLAGFFGKFYMFMEALKSDEHGTLSLTWLVAVALINSVISAFYYVRVLKAMFLSPAGARVVTQPPACLSLPIVLAAVTVVAVGLASAPLLDTMKGAALPMLTASPIRPTLDKYREPRKDGPRYEGPKGPIRAEGGTRVSSLAPRPVPAPGAAHPTNRPPATAPAAPE